MCKWYQFKGNRNQFRGKSKKKVTYLFDKVVTNSKFQLSPIIWASNNSQDPKNIFPVKNSKWRICTIRTLPSGSLEAIKTSMFT